MAHKRQQRTIYVSKRELIKNFFSGLLTAFLIIAAVACICIAILLTMGHSSTVEGGVLYDFLPKFMHNSTYIHAEIPVPVQSNPVAPLVADLEAYEPGLYEPEIDKPYEYESDAYEAIELPFNGHTPDPLPLHNEDKEEYEPEYVLTSEPPSQPDYYHEHDYIDDHVAYALMLYELLAYYDNPTEELPYVPVPGLENDPPPYFSEDFVMLNPPPVYYEPEPTPEVMPEPPSTRPPPPLASRIYPPGTPFHLFSFFIPDNADNYAYFHYNNPHLSTEEVVWKVNAHLHLPFHYYIRTNYHPNPLLVNPSYRLPPGFSPYYMVPVNNASCNLRGTPEAVAAFHLMRDTASAAGYYLSITSAFRTAVRQGQLFSNRNYVDGVVARPYHSEHQTGRALDLWGPGGLLDARGPSATGRWVAANAHNYGFIIRYGAATTHITGFIHEPWHITYVGTYIAMYMHYNNILSLEEFVGRNPGAEMGWTYPRIIINQETE